MLGEMFGCQISAVEPNDNMREEGQKFTQNLSNISWHKGSGEETCMSNNQADWVIMASSFIGQILKNLSQNLIVY